MLSNYLTIGCWEANELLKLLTDQFQYLHVTYNAIFIRTFVNCKSFNRSHVIDLYQLKLQYGLLLLQTR